MRAHVEWWEILMPWLDSVRLSAGGTDWTGIQPDEGHIDLDSREGPIVVRSISGGDGPRFRRTLAACAEYALDIALVSSPGARTMDWSLAASHMRSIQPPSFPRPGASLPLEARWIVEWRQMAGPKVRTSGESGHGILAHWDPQEDRRAGAWRLSLTGLQALFTACHEPSDRPHVQTTSTAAQEGRYTVRVTGDGFADYWMLDPAHTPTPLQLGQERIEIGSGWGYVRLERGRETTYGALRQDWGS